MLRGAVVSTCKELEKDSTSQMEATIAKASRAKLATFSFHMMLEYLLATTEGFFVKRLSGEGN
jgi:hypothetical protein